MTFPDRAAPLVYLLGWPAVGKLTVAQEVARRTGWRVVDNHFINDTIFSVIGATGQTPLPPGTHDLTLKVRQAVLEAMATLAPPELGFVLTNALFDTPLHRTLFSDVEAVAVQRGAPFLPVLLTCDVPGLRERVVSEGRRSRLKPRTTEALSGYLTTRTLLVPDHPHLLTLDTTHLSPEQTADAVLVRLYTLTGGRWGRREEATD